MTTNKLPLIRLSGELTALTGKQAPNYRKLWTLVADGRLTTEQINGRHFVDRAQVPRIARSLGLT